MLKLAIGISTDNPLTPPKSKGFTFIELMVVLVILGIVFQFALLSWGDFGERRRVIVAAEQLTTFFNALQDEAVLENNLIGVRVRTHDYQLLRFQTKKGWQPRPTRLHPPKLPANTLLHAQGAGGEAQIVIDAQGDINAFKLDLGNARQSAIATLFRGPSGNVELQVHP